MNKIIKSTISVTSTNEIERRIYVIRGQKVMMDEDLAVLYGVETRNLNKAVHRNRERFPGDFMFQLTREEWDNLKFQIGTSSLWGGRRKLPRLFTEQGVAMLSSVLRSPRAVAINIEIMRAFVRLRHVLVLQEKTGQELATLKSFILKHSHKTDQEFRRVWRAIEALTTPPKAPATERRMGFDLSQPS